MPLGRTPWHREEFLEHGHIFHWRDLAYDTVVKTPLIMWIPGMKAGQVVDALAQNIDILPTILDYLAIDSKTYRLDGKSLRPAIEQNQAVHKYVFGMQPYARSVTDGRYKLIYNNRTGDIELFDRSADPGEQTNIAARRPQLAEALTEVLIQWVDSTEGDVDVGENVDKAREVTDRLRSLGYL